MIGKVFQTLTIGGRQYSSVTVKDINDTGFRIQHSGGLARIDWGGTSGKVKDVWGFDEDAYLQFQKMKKVEQIFAENQNKRQSNQKEPITNSAKTAVSEEAQKNELIREIGEVESKIARGTVMLESFVKDSEVLHEEYDQQDKHKAAMKAARLADEDGFIRSKSVGGISTSKVDRQKKLYLMDSRVLNAKLALNKLKSRLKTLERELDSLPLPTK